MPQMGVNYTGGGRARHIKRRSDNDSGAQNQKAHFAHNNHLMKKKNTLDRIVSGIKARVEDEPPKQKKEGVGLVDFDLQAAQKTRSNEGHSLLRALENDEDIRERLLAKLRSGHEKSLTRGQVLRNLEKGHPTHQLSWQAAKPKIHSTSELKSTHESKRRKVGPTSLVPVTEVGSIEATPKSAGQERESQLRSVLKERSKESLRPPPTPLDQNSPPPQLPAPLVLPAILHPTPLTPQGVTSIPFIDTIPSRKVPSPVSSSVHSLPLSMDGTFTLSQIHRVDEILEYPDDYTPLSSPYQKKQSATRWEPGTGAFNEVQGTQISRYGALPADRHSQAPNQPAQAPSSSQTTSPHPSSLFPPTRNPFVDLQKSDSLQISSDGLHVPPAAQTEKHRERVRAQSGSRHEKMQRRRTEETESAKNEKKSEDKEGEMVPMAVDEVDLETDFPLEFTSRESEASGSSDSPKDDGRRTSDLDLAPKVTHVSSSTSTQRLASCATRSPPRAYRPPPCSVKDESRSQAPPPGHRDPPSFQEQGDVVSTSVDGVERFEEGKFKANNVNPTILVDRINAVEEVQVFGERMGVGCRSVGAERKRRQDDAFSLWMLGGLGIGSWCAEGELTAGEETFAEEDEDWTFMGAESQISFPLAAPLPGDIATPVLNTEQLTPSTNENPTHHQVASGLCPFEEESNFEIQHQQMANYSPSPVKAYGPDDENSADLSNLTFPLDHEDHIYRRDYISQMRHFLTSGNRSSALSPPSHTRYSFSCRRYNYNEPEDYEPYQEEARYISGTYDRRDSGSHSNGDEEEEMPPCYSGEYSDWNAEPPDDRDLDFERLTAAYHDEGGPAHDIVLDDNLRSSKMDDGDGWFEGQWSDTEQKTNRQSGPALFSQNDRTGIME